MEDDEKVKDETVPDKAPEKNLKKPSGKSATGKPLDGIDINPQLNDVSTDGNQLKIRKEDSVDLTVPVIQERKALTLPQRQKRGRQLRAREHSMERAREVAKTRLASKTKIQQRAISHARAIVKKRFAARKGTPYAELTTSEKIQVDTAVSKKTKLIQKIAARLLPRIRKAEFERLQSFRNGGPLKDLSTQNPKAQGIMPKVTEEMSQLFNTLNDHDVTSLIGIIENAIDQFKQDNDPMGDQLKKMLIAVLPEDVVTESLLKKSDKTGIAFSTLKEVFDRGEYSWDASNRMTQEQFAFARVNSYIGKGKAWHMDADIREEKNMTIDEELNFAFNKLIENNYHVGLSGTIAKKREAHWKNMQQYSDKDQRAYQDAPGDKEARKKSMPQSQHTKKYHAMYGESKHTETATQERQEIKYVKRNTGNKEKDVDPHYIRRAHQQIQNKVIDESGNTPYVKPHIEKGSTNQSGWKASNKHGNVKYFGMDFKASAHKHAGINEAVDKHPIVKEYEVLKKNDIKTLRGMIAQSGGVVDTSGFKSKDHAASHIIRSKHGNKKVDAAFGFNEDTSADREVGTKSLVKKYQKKTPGQEKADINEIFNTAFDEDIERRGDFKMVKVRTPKGYIWKKVRHEVDIEKDAE